jgi:hypothetical protein
MRPLTTIAVLAVACAMAPAASGSDQRAATLEAVFAPMAAGLSAAVDLHMTWADAGEPNAKPQQVHRLTLAFPVGTRIDTAAFARCKASDKQVRAKGPSACPRASRLATGQSLATTGSSQIQADVVLINAPRQIIVVVLVNKAVFAVYRDDVTRSTVTVNFALPAVVSLLDLRIHIPLHASGHGSKRRIYFRTPSSCPASGAWSMTATSLYADGSTQTAPAAVACGPSRSAVKHPG